MARKRAAAVQTPTVSCFCIGGPLDGQTIAVGGDLGSYYCTQGQRQHVYYRRCHPSALLEPDSKRTVLPSFLVFDHQPHLTVPRG